jgi:hypothetical protein
MGVLAFDDGEPVGWCACGPRSRREGVSHTLVGAAVDLGRERVFADLGFRDIHRSGADRVVMRLELR